MGMTLISCDYPYSKCDSRHLAACAHNSDKANKEIIISRHNNASKSDHYSVVCESFTFVGEMRLRPLIFVFLSLCALHAPVYAQELSEQEVADMFMQQSLALIAAKSQVDIATAQVVMAKELSNPTLALNVTGLGESHGWGEGYWNQPYNNSISMSQLIETAGKRQLRIEGAEIGEQAQQLLFTDLVRSLKRDVLTAYYAVVMNQRRVVIYDEILTQLNETLTANNLRWKAGDISETEFRRIELEAFKAKTDVEQAHLDLDTSRQQLSEMLAHSLPAEQLTLRDDFPPRDLPNLKPAELFATALTQRNDVRAAELTIAQQDAQLRLAEVQKVPDVVVGAQYTHDPSATLPDSAGLGIAMTVPLWHQYQGEVEQARSSKRVAETMLTQLEKQVQTQVAVALAQYQQKKHVLARFDQDVISRAKQVRKSSVLAYRQGAISLLELLDAEGNYRNIMLNYNQSLYDQTAAWLDLMYAMGEEGNK
jgi:cobalt-zinc-cadmium efflux system outer membrane protein